MKMRFLPVLIAAMAVPAAYSAADPAARAASGKKQAFNNPFIIAGSLNQNKVSFSSPLSVSFDSNGDVSCVFGVLPSLDEDVVSAGKSGNKRALAAIFINPEAPPVVKGALDAAFSNFAAEAHVWVAELANKVLKRVYGSNTNAIAPIIENGLIPLQIRFVLPDAAKQKCEKLAAFFPDLDNGERELRVTTEQSEQIRSSNPKVKEAQDAMSKYDKLQAEYNAITKSIGWLQGKAALDQAAAAQATAGRTLDEKKAAYASRKTTANQREWDAAKAAYDKSVAEAENAKKMFDLVNSMENEVKAAKADVQQYNTRSIIAASVQLEGLDAKESALKAKLTDIEKKVRTIYET
jgi:hypothetical protein